MKSSAIIVIVIVIAMKWYGSIGAVESVWTYTLSKFSPDPSMINRKVFGYIRAQVSLVVFQVCLWNLSR